MKKVFEKAKEFIYRNARPLDFARFAYHFENGSLHAVLDALAFYRRESPYHAGNLKLSRKRKRF